MVKKIKNEFAFLGVLLDIHSLFAHFRSGKKVLQRSQRHGF